MIVGGGISGLLAAWLVARKNGDRKVYVVEQNKDVGGLLRSFDYGEFGRYDYGMHNMLETGIAELDELLFGLLNKEEWHLLEGNKRDLAGLFFRGRLQTHSPYVDLRSLPAADFERCLASFFSNLNKPHGDPTSNAADYARYRFGDAIAEAAIVPVIKKMFKKDASHMDVMATMITPLGGRVVLFGEEIFPDLMRSNTLRSRVAYPVQQHLPEEHSSGKKAYYPKNYGMYRVIDALKSQLERLGVRLLTETKITKAYHDHSRVTAVQLNRRHVTTELTNISDVCWTVGLPPLAKVLEIPFDNSKYDRPLKTVIVNLLTDQELDMADLYYFYCYDDGYGTFRVTNYHSYCPGAVRSGGFPSCVELLIDNVPQGGHSSFVDQAVSELQQFGVWKAGTNLLFGKSEILQRGFPMPSLDNIASIDSIRERLRVLDLKNLMTMGILSKKGLFFQGDVLANVYTEIVDREES